MPGFDYTHYVPVLRWRRAEWDALCKLFQSEHAVPAVNSSRFTPLIEITPKKFTSDDPEVDADVKGQLEVVAYDIMQNWGVDPVFVDLQLLPEGLRKLTTENPLNILAQEMSCYGLFLVPATGLNRTKGYQQAVWSVTQRYGNGVCLRLKPSDFQRRSLSTDIFQLLDYLILSP